MQSRLHQAADFTLHYTGLLPPLWLLCMHTAVYSYAVIIMTDVKLAWHIAWRK